MNTHIVVVVDESSSMHSRTDEVKDGFADMLTEQRKQPGTATMTIVKFASDVPVPLIAGQDIIDIKPMIMDSYRPNGMTALYDAIGFSITDTSTQIKLKEIEPDNVLVVILTDGQENASREFDSEAIQKLVQSKKDESWDFMFIGADEETLQAQTRSINVNPNHAFSANYNVKGGTRAALNKVSHTTTGYRSGATLAEALGDAEDDEQT